MVSGPRKFSEKARLPKDTKMEIWITKVEQELGLSTSPRSSQFDWRDFRFLKFLSKNSNFSDEKYLTLARQKP